MAGRAGPGAYNLPVDQVRHLLEAVAGGELTVDEGLSQLRWQPFENLDFARVDHHRALRTGSAEVIFCRGKSPEQVVAIARSLLSRSPRVLCTRVEADQADALGREFDELQLHPEARAVVVGQPVKRDGEGEPYVAVISAGTADLPVAEEAALTLRALGGSTRCIWDCGVAGLHRLLADRAVVDRAHLAIVVAGMEGALPSVVGGLLGKPVIAVPTSIGYGASFGGLAALLGMLNSCASGVVVTNIDNGFGAGFFAAQMLRIIGSSTAGENGA